MNLKTAEQFKSVAYRICDERDCLKIAWKSKGERQFCDAHYSKFLEEGKSLFEIQAEVNEADTID